MPAIEISTDPAAPARAAGRFPWRRDLLASLVVFMVALPLCIAIAEASGLPPEAGIITGIVGGVVVGVLSGSPLQVSGPAAGLIVLVLEFMQSRAHLLDSGQAAASPAVALSAALVLAGLLQLLGGVLRLGRWFRAVSPAVVLGMLAGIGGVIVVKQAHVMADVAPAERVADDLRDLPGTLAKGFSGGQHSAALLVGLLTAAVMVLWKPLALRRLKLVPAALVGVVLAVALAEGLGLGVRRVEVASNLLDAVRWFRPGDLGLWLETDVLEMALAVALIASAETLLCAGAVDRLHNGPRTRYDRELAAQGVGNTLCGLLGALPMTGVIVRSSANVQAGARTRLSAILHGIWLLLFVVFLDGLLERIPLACLAGILVYTGVKLIDAPGAVRLWRQSRGEGLIFLGTFAAVVATDLLTGVLFGVALAALKLVLTFARLRIRRDEDLTRRRTTLHLEGAATFLRLPELAAALEAVPPGTTLHVHFERLTYIDHACLQLLLGWARQHEATGGQLLIDWESLHARFHSPRQPGEPPTEAAGAGRAG